MLHRRKAGGLRGLRELPGERLPQPAELRLRRERRLDLLRPRRLPRAPVRAGARALPRFPPLERPVGMHGEHYRIEIFEGNRFSGHSLEFTEDCSFLQGRGWDKNYVNAIKAWVLYEKPSYRGCMYVVERGEFSSCHEWHAQRPNVQSIRRVINYY